MASEKSDKLAGRAKEKAEGEVRGWIIETVRPNAGHVSPAA